MITISIELIRMLDEDTEMFTNVVGEVRVTYHYDDDDYHAWEFARPALDLLNGYIEQNGADLNHPEQYAVVCRVASCISNVNPLLIAADPDHAIRVIHLLLTGQAHEMESMIAQHEEAIMESKFVAEKGMLN